MFFSLSAQDKQKGRNICVFFIIMEPGKRYFLRFGQQFQLCSLEKELLLFLNQFLNIL